MIQQDNSIDDFMEFVKCDDIIEFDYTQDGLTFLHMLYNKGVSRDEIIGLLINVELKRQELIKDIYRASMEYINSGFSEKYNPIDKFKDLI